MAEPSRTSEPTSSDSSNPVQAGSCAKPCHARKTVTVRFSEDELRQIREARGNEALTTFIRNAALGKAEAIELIARMEAS